MSAGLNWFGHTSQEVKSVYELEEFTELQFNTVLLYPDSQKIIY